MFLYDQPNLKFPATQQVDDDSWVLLRPFWHIASDGLVTFIPPSGVGPPERIAASPVWTTDYRSGPELPSLPKQGHYAPAWLKHDFGYASEGYLPIKDGGRSRATLDWQLLQDLEELGANWLQRNRVWLGVRLGGNLAAYSKHKRSEVAKLRSWHQFCLPLFPMPKFPPQ